MKKNLDGMWELISTWFYVGKSRYAPGTVGSLATLPVAYFLNSHLGSGSVVAFVVLVSLLGIVASEKFSEILGVKDPGMIVIDEVAGQSLTLVFAGINLYLYLIGFALFRVLDILKPWPVSWADQKVPGGLGIMLDDLIAGFIGMILVFLLKVYAF